jgi:hypothetical protein
MKEPATGKRNQSPNLGGWIMAGVLVAVFSVFGQAMALNEPAQPAKNEQAQPAKNLNEYFRGKYIFRNSTDFVTSSIRPTLYGPKGRLGISAEIRMGNVPSLPSEHGQARAIAKAFLEEEGAVLGITDMNEIHETKVYRNEENTTFVLYTRIINGLELDGMYVHIAIRKDGIIRSVDATLVPVSPEVYEATTKKTLSKEQIRRIVDQDLRSFPRKGSKPDLSRAEFNKYAVPDVPYVVWDVKAGRHYRIDAFTGEILRKTEMRTVDP